MIQNKGSELKKLTVMIFKSEKARNFLLQNAVVFTFRKRRRKARGKDWISDGYGKPKIADAEILQVKCCTPKDLGNYVHASGFQSLEEWQEEIKRLNKGTLPEMGWLYFVKLPFTIK